ncbi:MAG TPA: IS21 family transposase [Rhizomicrobium sp.]|nr:IS21 family transposase [Rhizomicrobium sp.]
MLTVLDYLQIRTAHAQGESIRSLARRLHRSQKTIRKVIGSPTGQPVPYRRSGPTVYPKLGPFIAFIEQVLKDDQTAPMKQRHTVMQLYRRLKGPEFAVPYSGEYNAVRRYVQRHRQWQAETFVPLTYQPGVRLECDFGHIHVDYPEGRKLVSVLVAAWSFSQALFLIKLPNEKTESVLTGTVAALAFFGCVPRELWWDNPKTVAWAIHRGRERSLNAHFAALASHYRMEPLFCMPRKGQEKSDAERSVFALQRRFGTPVPVVQDDAELNTYLRRFCEAELTRTVAGRSRTIGEEFALEKGNALSLPAHGFDACVTRPAVVDKYQTVRVDRCRYSVPRECAFRPVTVKLYPERLEIVHGGKVVAEHRRLEETEASILDPLHYLPTLLRKPATLDHANVFTTWELPASFQDLRQILEQCHGPATGTRHYIRVLQLLLRHPVERVARAWEACRQRPHVTAEMITEKTLALAHAADARLGEAPSAMPPGIPSVTVPPPDLRRFDQLLSQSLPTEPVAQGASYHGPCLPIPFPVPGDAAEVSSQDPAIADHAGGILQACA